jgi:hypothetical protein
LLALFIKEEDVEHHLANLAGSRSSKAGQHATQACCSNAGGACMM